MRTALLIASALAVVGLHPGDASATGAARPSITVLSNRADLISGGDALVAIGLPRGVTPSRVRVTVERRVRRRVRRRDVTRAFAVRPNGRFEGVVSGLPLGRSTLRARIGRRRGAAVPIVNRPNGGPVFSGPQVQPWVCQATAVDAQCNQPAEYTFLYKSTDATKSGLQPYDPAEPPSDVATTRTDQGVRVPFVVRLETGYQDRDQYKILTLYRPGEPWEPWAPQRQWNRKVLVTHGGGCGASHEAGSARLSDYSGTLPATPGIEDSYVVALGRGFAVMSTALNNNGHNCNLATQAESMVMAKEHLVETYGPVRYTIGTGCSGGALVQQQVANAYPGGIYEGLIVTCSYPDTLTPGAQFADYHLLRLYFEHSSRWGPGIAWSPTQWGAVEGHLSHLNAITADEGLFKSATDPTYPCAGVSDEQRYHPERNPGGARCSILDHMINVLGPRPESAWSPVERALGRGFAGAPFGNVGVQYGLKALQRGEITAAQFVDLNARIGGLDIDVRPTAERSPGDDHAIRNAYRSGAINEANNLDRVAIINHAGPDPGVAHDFSHAWWTRDRLEREHGHFRNHVLWFGQTPLIGDPRWATEALIAMDRWLAAVERDNSDRPLADKIVDDKPADITDRCSNLPGLELVRGVCEQPDLQTHYGTPRTVAGGPVTNDNTKCELRPLRREEYPVAFSDEQWAQLEQAFPTGVCDYARPAVGQQGAIPWQTYQERDGRVIYGGRRLGPVPARSGSGWASEAFRPHGTSAG